MTSWQEVNKIAVGFIAATGTGIGVLGLFSLLFMLSGISYEYSSDSVCDGLECPAYINLSSSTWRICVEHPSDSQNMYLPYNQLYGGSYTKLTKVTYGELNSSQQPVLYKKSTYGRTLWINRWKIDNVIITEPSLSVDWYFPTIKRYANHSDEYGYWRHIKDGDCWDRGKVNKNKLIVHAIEATIIKWSFLLEQGDFKIDIDPLLASWEYIYAKNKTIQNKVYYFANESYKVPVYKNFTEEVCCVKGNKSCNPCKITPTCVTNICYEYNYEIIDHYDTKWHLVQKSSLVNETVVDTKSKRKGVKIGNKEILGYVNVQNETFAQWDVPVGDRNYNEYGRCRLYEVIKGVCEETNLRKIAGLGDK